MKYGETTALFIRYLKENGPQTDRQLREGFPRYSGIRSRIPTLIKQGRVAKVDVVNPLMGRCPRSHAVVKAYKAVDGAAEGTVRRDGTYQGPDGLTWKDRRAIKQKQARKEAAISRAISLLEDNGYRVEPPLSQGGD